jgi:RNA polymerase sigma-70 factor (ECF subfamily)
MTTDRIVAEYYEPLARFALHLTGNSFDAGDLIHDTFYKAHGHSHQIRDEKKTGGWLRTVMRRLHLTSVERNGRFSSLDADTGVLESLESESPRDCALDLGEAVKALRGLEPRYQAPLTLFYLEEKSYEEISRILEIPMGTVMSRLSRGRALLRDHLAPESVESTGACRQRMSALAPSLPFSGETATRPTTNSVRSLQP